MTGRDITNRAINAYTGTFRDFIDKIDKGANLCAERKTYNDLSSCPLYAAYQTLSKIKSIVILMHSPQGCATSMWFLCGGALSLKTASTSSTNDVAVTLTTAIDNTAAINGTNDLLYDALVEIERNYHPEYTIVLTSCYSALAGDAIEDVILKVKAENPGAHIDWLSTAGCESWYWSNGYDMVHEFLVNRIMPMPTTVVKQADKVNIISFGNAAAIDVSECSRLLKLLGLRTHVPIDVPYTSISNIQNASDASVNVLMCKAYGQKFCECMSLRYGTQFVDASHPIGSYFTQKWLESIARLFGVEEKAYALVASEKERIAEDLKRIKQILGNKRVAISAGHDKLASLLLLVEELQMKIVYAGVLTYDDTSKEKFLEVSNILSGDFPCFVNPQSYEESRILNDIKPDVFIGPAGQTPRVALMNISTVSCHFNDMLGAYFGFEGIVNYGKQIIRAMANNNTLIAPHDFLYSGAEKICGRDFLRGGTSYQ